MSHWFDRHSVDDPLLVLALSSLSHAHGCKLHPPWGVIVGCLLALVRGQLGGLAKGVPLISEVVLKICNILHI